MQGRCPAEHGLQRRLAVPPVRELHPRQRVRCRWQARDVQRQSARGVANGVGQKQLGGAPENLQRASGDGPLRALATVGSTWSLVCTKRAVLACSAGCRAGQCSCGHAGHCSARVTSQTKSWGVSGAEEGSMKGEGARERERGGEGAWFSRR